MKTIVIGAAIIDMIMKVERLPKSGEDILCREQKVVVGGCAYNVASTLRNLSCDHDLCVPVGTGTYADIINAKLKEDGYRSLIKEKDGDNGSCLSLVEADGERTFITLQGIEKDFQTEWLQAINIENYDYVYFPGYQVCGDGESAIAKWVGTFSGKTIFFAPGPVITNIPETTMKQIFDVYPIVHLNEKEIMDYTGKNSLEESIYALYKQNKNSIIVTLGSEGTLYFDGKEICRIQGEKAIVVDTIGAGDSHVAAVIAGLSRGLCMDASIKQANKVAAGIVGVEGPVMTKEEFNRKIGE